MLNSKLGAEVKIGGRRCIRVEAGRHGCAIYGPYEQVEQGNYRIDYFLQRVQNDAPGRFGSVKFDVTTDFGNFKIIEHQVDVKDLKDDGEVISLFFKLDEPRTLEYRAHVDGEAPLFVGNDPLVDLSEGIDRDSAINPCRQTDNPEEIAEQVRSVLRFLRPQVPNGHFKTRFGRAGDGGYICIDDLDGVDVGLSLGINDEISWDRAVADRGLTVYQFDHTVDDPAPHDHRMIFEKKMIAANGGEGTEDLGHLVRLHDKGLRRPNIFLKMDIECGEWSVLNAISPQELARFSQITCELHAFQNLADLEWRQGMYRALRKLHRDYGLVHVHGNNHSGFSNINNVIVPNVIEATFANRSMYDLRDSNELFPGPMDIACDSHTADLFLGSFRF